MIEIVKLEDLNKGDIILIESMGEDAVHVVTVEEITSDGLIIPAEMAGLDYAPEDPDQIVKIGFMSKTHPGTVLRVDSYWVTVQVPKKPDIG